MKKPSRRYQEVGEDRDHIRQQTVQKVHSSDYLIRIYDNFEMEDVRLRLVFPKKITKRRQGSFKSGF